MRKLNLSKAFTLIEPGPVVLVTTNDGTKNNIMTISWTMVLDFTPAFALTTGEWNHSYAALRRTRQCVIAIPTVDMLDKAVGIGTSSGVTLGLAISIGGPLAPAPAPRGVCAGCRACASKFEPRGARGWAAAGRPPPWPLRWGAGRCGPAPRGCPRRAGGGGGRGLSGPPARH